MITGWISVDDQLPKTDQIVLATDSGKSYLVAMYCHHGEHEGEDYDELDVGSWSEDENHWYWPAGWYEQQICWDDFKWLQCHERDFKPTHWVPLPDPAAWRDEA